MEVKLTRPDAYANSDEFKKTEGAYKQLVAKLAAANKEYEIVFEKIISLDEELLG